MKQISTFIFLFIFISTINAQYKSDALFSKEDKIEIEFIANTPIYTHTIEKGHTLYSLSKVFGIKTEQLYANNGLSKEAPISLGQSIRIPIDHHSIFKAASLRNLKYGHYIPVIYKVKAKETLYRIAKIYFEQSVEDIKARNQLKDNNLSLNQEILIGWWPIDSNIKMDLPIETNGITEEVNNPSPEVVLTGPVLPNDTSLLTEGFEHTEVPLDFQMLLNNQPYKDSYTLKSTSEVANWDKSIPDNGMVFALHSAALLDSHIRITNPVLNRSVRAKVIGRIPYGSYTSDVKLVLSPRAAIQLGALDGRFKVDVEYINE